MIKGIHTPDTLKEYMAAHKNYGQTVGDIMLVAPDTESELDELFAKIRASWKRLKVCEAVHFEREVDAETII